MPIPGAYWLAPDSRARSAAAITSGGPSTSGKPWPRFTAPVRTASADIVEKIVGGMPSSLLAVRTRVTGSGTVRG